MTTTMTKFWNEARKTTAGVNIYAACDRTMTALSDAVKSNVWGLPYNYDALCAAHHSNVRALLRHLGLPDSAYFAAELCTA